MSKQGLNILIQDFTITMCCSCIIDAENFNPFTNYDNPENCQVPHYLCMRQKKLNYIDNAKHNMPEVPVTLHQWAPIPS